MMNSNKLIQTFQHFQQGLTLIELLVALAMIALIYTCSIPNLNTFLMRQERELVLNNLKTAIYYAQNEALAQGKTIILCNHSPSKQSTCEPKQWNKWNDGFLVVTGQQVLARFPALTKGTLKFESIRHNIAFEPNGTTHKTNGTFTYCPFNKNSAEARTLIINDAGRPYLNGNKDAEGYVILCS